MLSTLGLLAVALEPEIATESVPTLSLVMGGVGGKFLTPIISLLIILGSVSTAVNMIAGMVARITKQFEKPDAAVNGKPSKLTIIATLVCTLAAFGIAQFGLLPLINKGYGLLGYLTIPVIMIPYIIHMIVTKWDTKTTK